MIIERVITPYIQRIAKHFPVVAIVGPRQSGKTFLVKRLFANKAYVNAEYPDTQRYISEDPRGFLEQYQDGAIIDEVQRVPEFFSYLQGNVDSDPRPGRFVLTGSQHFLLHERISQSLAGRVAIATLLPLSADELSSAHALPRTLEQALVTGWYPKVHAESLDIGEWYNNYRATYVERDVRQIKQIVDLGTFQSFLKLCASRTGQLLNLSSLGLDAGITHNTVRSWIDILEASFLVVKLSPYYRNFRKRVVKMPKFHFLDSGLLCSLLGIRTPEQLRDHPLFGSIFESFVAAELLKNRFNNGIREPLYFWRDKSGNEVDYILDDGRHVISLEAKAGKTVTSEMFSGLASWVTLSGEDSAHSYLVYGGGERSRRTHATVLSWHDVSSVALSPRHSAKNMIQ